MAPDASVEAVLRESGAEFAREFPKIAGRLALEEFSCADPYVERLIESFAFLAAGRFGQSALCIVFEPHSLHAIVSVLSAGAAIHQGDGR